MKQKIIFYHLMILLVILLIGYSSNTQLEDATTQLEEVEQHFEEEKNNLVESTTFTDQELAEMSVNELGQVMILMYHVIGDKEGQWSRTKENFRSDLQRLYELGYRTVLLSDFLKGQIATPAGTTPIVITFDDGTIGQFRYMKQDGQVVVDPHCAVGIMLDFAKEHPEFGNAATFFINGHIPFGQEEYWQDKLQFLVDNGMEIGNHGYHHHQLSKLSDEEVEKELALLVDKVKQVLNNYKVESMALPYGSSPKNLQLAVTGSYEGKEYDHLGVLRVGANPARPPAHENYDLRKIPRVRADQTELDKWLNYFEQKPHLRYISDGDSNTITIPKSLEESLDKEQIGNRTLIIYGEEQH